uniref:Integrase catalytic domain-containing protein n=1 Tax=Tanacetum cinerariifolium TaxID=118510 RepID=A0A6L2NY58_TANCI|nr:hypothetical protein [Tanacetum cinerariifolium]
MKEIKREFSVAITPQQNRVAKRKNRTLIEAARTMLADSLLPIPFWAEAVNTACYVQNRVLVTKPHNKTPYELLFGLTLAPQTRSMARMVKEQGGLNQINNEDFHTCMFTCFFSQEEPKRVHQALKDPSWIKAMQEELLHFKMQKVWVLVDLPNGKRDIGSKWVFRNKKDKRGIVIRKKARLVAQRHTQEEGINYEEVFALVVRIEVIRLFFAYASFMGFKDPDYPNKVYKVVKALYGLHKAPRAWYETLANYLLENGFERGKIDLTLFIKKQKGDILLVQQIEDGILISQDKYVAKIFRKFGLIDGKSASTPIDTEKPLLKDLDGEDVDAHIYRSMIGSLMYLTSSRPDIMLAICACAQFQVTPKVSHLHAVKRIFRYLKGKPHLGLWYPKDSSFNLVAYSKSDYAEASLDRKSTTGGCQFLGCRLISWQCKNQTVVATSSTEAEHVATASLARMGYEKPPLKLTFYKAFFSAQWMFLIHTLVQCVSAKRTAWNEFSYSMASAVICLVTVIINNQVDDISSHTIKYTSPAFTQKVFTNIKRIGKGFSGVETHLFATMLVQPQAAAKEEDEEDAVAALEQDKVAQALEIFKLKRKVKKLEKKRGSKSSGLKRGRIEAIDTDKDITLVDMETEVDLDAELQGRIKRKDDAMKVNAAEPTMAKRLHDEEVKQAAAREKQETDNLEKAKVLQQQYDQKQENIDWNVVAEQMQG